MYSRILKPMCAQVCAVPGGGRGRVPQVKLNISIATVLVDRIEQQLKKRGTAVSVADFVRQAAAEKIDRLERDERGERDPIDLNALGDPLRRARSK
jgi:hypothetical protein